MRLRSWGRVEARVREPHTDERKVMIKRVRQHYDVVVTFYRLPSMLVLLSLLCCKPSLGQELATCIPVSERTKEIGCWVLANRPIGQLSTTPMYWCLDSYESRAAAESDKVAHLLAQQCPVPPTDGSMLCRRTRMRRSPNRSYVRVPNPAH